MSDIKRERSDKTGFSSPFLPDDVRASEIKTRLFRELQERLSIEVPNTETPEYNDTRLQQHFEYLEQEVEYLLSLRPPEVNEEVGPAIFVRQNPKQIPDEDKLANPTFATFGENGLPAFNPSVKDGKTWDTALDNLADAMKLWLLLMEKDGTDLPIWVAGDLMIQALVDTSTSSVDDPIIYSDPEDRFVISNSDGSAIATSEHIMPLSVPCKIYGGFSGGESSLAERSRRTKCAFSLFPYNVAGDGVALDSKVLSYRTDPRQTDTDIETAWEVDFSSQLTLGDVRDIIDTWDTADAVIDGFEFDWLYQGFRLNLGGINDSILSDTENTYTGTRRIISTTAGNTLTKITFINCLINEGTASRSTTITSSVTGLSYNEELINTGNHDITFRSCVFEGYKLNMTIERGDYETDFYPDDTQPWLGVERWEDYTDVKDGGAIRAYKTIRGNLLKIINSTIKNYTTNFIGVDGLDAFAGPAGYRLAGSTLIEYSYLDSRDVVPDEMHGGDATHFYIEPPFDVAEINNCIFTNNQFNHNGEDLVAGDGADGQPTLYENVGTTDSGGTYPFDSLERRETEVNRSPFGDVIMPRKHGTDNEGIGHKGGNGGNSPFGTPGNGGNGGQNGNGDPLRYPSGGEIFTDNSLIGEVSFIRGGFLTYLSGIDGGSASTRIDDRLNYGTFQKLSDKYGHTQMSFGDGMNGADGGDAGASINSTGSVGLGSAGAPADDGTWPTGSFPALPWEYNGGTPVSPAPTLVNAGIDGVDGSDGNIPDLLDESDFFPNLWDGADTFIPAP